ncbi:DMT family transporter [Jatrophihabitans cynanchi]|uniref:DMT family transporter n=1 Tax=Jatrophihabitans cynanchi TaxID=2944128 RepID=A0ABY7JY98_9ACTN|nr:DMT family transporter [Jatrophihabitans sp. SB3-54]WAX57273.1 DMT family transporter [Jatrophihabitans sp. SB3-54]
MVYLVGLLAAASIGFGWVLQQRAAVRRAAGDPLTPRLILRLVRDGSWWCGVAAMVSGNLLWALTLHLGTVSLVEPLLATSLVFAFLFSALLRRQPPSAVELSGAVLVVVALAGFVVTAQPEQGGHATPEFTETLAAVVAVAGLALALVALGRRVGFAAASAAFATAAGVLYGLQDVAARWALVSVDRHGLVALLTSPGTYLVAGTALGGLLLSQSAFGAARLTHSLPSLTVTEPLVGIGLGVALLDDRLVTSGDALMVESLCLAALVCGVLLVSQSLRVPASASAPADPRDLLATASATP